MTAGRKSLPKSLEAAAETLPAETLEAIAHDMSESAAYPVALAAAAEETTALAKTLGYEGSLVPDVLESGIRESLDRINFEMFAAGARLLLLKQQCIHGEFMERLERLGLDDGIARRTMRATLKFSNRPTSADLARLGKSKLFELAVLDDEEADEFADGGTVRGITYDDVAKLSVSALRARLRQAEADKEAEVSKVKAAVAGELAAKDRVIADKAKHIAKLVEEKNRAESMTADERAAELERTLSNELLQAIGSLKPISQAIQRFRALPDAPHGLYVASQNALDRVMAEVMAIAAEHGIELNQLAAFDADAYADPNDGESFDGDELRGLDA